MSENQRRRPTPHVDLPGDHLFLLVGLPAVGKLSVATEIGLRTGAIVVDNHLVNNAVFVPMGLGRGLGVELADTDALRGRVYDVVVESTLLAPAGLSHVFTVWLPDGPGNAAHVDRLRTLAGRRGARFVPIWLTASPEALLARIDAPGRAERSKLTDREVLRDLLELPVLSPPEDAITLDLSTMGPEDAAAQVLHALT
ncbi:AAA family ATPase [Brachybacterium tyrofermentans]|uniref:AAA family ATPase n=1 Tax=Brachybacterium tyrofermentans TaxID=47848 RepID=UPI003FD4063F